MAKPNWWEIVGKVLTGIEVLKLLKSGVIYLRARAKIGVEEATEAEESLDNTIVTWERAIAIEGDEMVISVEMASTATEEGLAEVAQQVVAEIGAAHTELVEFFTEDLGASEAVADVSADVVIGVAAE